MGELDGKSYRRGFEDAAEPCLAELNEAKSLEEAKHRLQEFSAN